MPSPRTSILLVEDDPDTRELYRLALIVAGFRVIAVGDGVEALRFVERERPTLIVLDLGLPSLSGADVQRELAAQTDTRDIPIVVVTGSEVATLDPSGFACILRKPATPDAVVEAVINCLKRHDERPRR
jgi:DNA-binding response OmpR family regulator